MQTEQLGDCTLVLGDCLEYMRGMDAGSVDAVVTDPPYYKVKGDWWDRQWETASGFLAWLDSVLAEVYRVLRPNGSLYMFASPRMAARVEVLIAERFNVLNHIVWVKTDKLINVTQHRGNQAEKEALRAYFPETERVIFAEHYGADGYAKGEAGYTVKCDELRGFVFEPLRAYLDGERARAGVSFEQVRKIVGCADGSGLPSHWFTQSQWMLPTADNYAKLRAGFSRYNHRGDYLCREYEDLRREYEDLRREYEDLRRPFSVTPKVPFTDVWTFPTVQGYTGKHPTEKPLPLMRHIIEASTRPDALVLDCFAGSGTTGVACVQTGRRFVGVEIDPGYYAIARRRILDAQAQPRLFADAPPPQPQQGALLDR